MPQSESAHELNNATRQLWNSTDSEFFIPMVRSESNGFKNFCQASGSLRLSFLGALILSSRQGFLHRNSPLGLKTVKSINK